MANDTDNNNIKYFLPGPINNTNKKASDAITELLQREFKDAFNGIACFDGQFSSQLKTDSKPYQCYVRQCRATMHFAKLPFNCLGVYQYCYMYYMDTELTQLLIIWFTGLCNT